VSLKKIIADNLRSLCDSYDGSIAQLSRRIGISPQQFNNYLTAKHIPNETVIAKVCDLFDIQEDEIYVSRRIHSRLQSVGNSAITPTISAALERFRSDERPDLDSGIYSTYFVTSEQPNSIVRAIMPVEWRDGYLTFRRFTSISRSARVGSGGNRSDHRGIIIKQPQDTFHFMAINQRPNHEPSLITTRWASSKAPLLSGYAVVETARGNTISAVVIAYENELTFRHLLKQMDYYSWDDKTVPQSVKRELEHLMESIKFRTS